MGGQETAVMMLAWFVGAFVNGVTGLGSAMVALPLLSLAIVSKDMIVVSAICGMLVAFAALAIYWKAFDFREDRLFWGFYALGAPFGLLTLKTVDIHILQFLLGLVTLFYVLWRVVQTARKVPMRVCRKPRQAAVFFGWLSGFFLGAISVGGPPTILYADVLGLDKDRARGLFVGGAFIHLILFPGFLLNGLVTSSVLLKTAYVLPALVLGLLIAYPVGKHINQKMFTLGLLLLLAVAAASLLVRSMAYYLQ